MRFIFWTVLFLVGYVLISLGALSVVCFIYRYWRFSYRLPCFRSQRDDEDDEEVVVRPYSRCRYCWRRTMRLVGRVLPLPRGVNVEARAYGKADDAYARWEDWMG